MAKTWRDIQAERYERACEYRDSFIKLETTEDYERYAAFYSDN